MSDTNRGWEKMFDLIDDIHRCGSNQCVDCPKDHHVSDFKRVISQSQSNLIDQVIELIKNSDSDLVCPIDTPPFREDYINKWKLLDKIKELVSTRRP